MTATLGSAAGAALLPAAALERQAAARPDATAYVALAGGEDEAERVSFAELERRVRACAAALRERCRPGERALVLAGVGIEFVVAFHACARAGVVAVATQPPEGWRLGMTLARAESVARDAEAGAVVSTGQLAAHVREAAPESELLSLPWLDVGRLAAEGADDAAPAHAPDPDEPAFVQYTSGSTGEPKGVVLSHANLASQAELLVESTAAGEGETSVSWAPLHHDMGLVTAVVLPVQAGMRCVLMSPLAFLQRPARWLEAIDRYGASFSGGPTFAYDLCCRRVSDEQRAAVSLAGWDTAFIGAEPVHAAVVDRFCELFAPCGMRRESLWASWGLAEASCVVTGSPPPERFSIRWLDRAALESGSARAAEPHAEGARRLVGAGRPVGGHEVLVVDAERREELPAGRVGELWVAGPSVGLGYWGRPDLTREAYGAELADGRGPYLRTGDLGLVLEGEVFVTGRIKDLVIVRGRNIAPQDVEHVAERSHSALRPGGGAAVSVHRGDHEELVVVHELERGAEGEARAAIAAVKRALGNELAISPGRVVATRAGAVPRTSSGKVRRAACRRALERGELTVVEERRWSA